MGYFLADSAYLTTLLLNLAAFVLLVEWLLHAVRGPALNGFRRLFFLVSYPLLKWSDGFLSIRWGSFNSRGLLTAILFLAVSRYGIPWLVLLAYSLRG